MTDEIEKIDPNTPLSALTAGQLMEFMQIENKRIAQLEKMREEYQQKLQELEVANRYSQSLFKDVREMSAITSPFTIDREDKLEEFINTCRGALKMGSSIVMIMGIKKDGKVAKAP